jgi:hypothetical protein
MTRGEMRALLRKQVQDVAEDQWQDSELDSILNLAYANVQKEIVKVDREAHLFWDYIDTVAGTSWYPLPQTFGISHVGVKLAASDTGYTVLGPPKRYRDVKDVETSSTTYYSIRGQWIGIFPAPGVGVTSGIELVHTPIMSIGAGLGNDGEVPRIKLPLHLAIVWWAKLICLGDTDEQAGEARARLAEMINDIPVWYSAHSDAVDILGVQT